MPIQSVLSTRQRMTQRRSTATSIYMRVTTRFILLLTTIDAHNAPYK